MLKSSEAQLKTAKNNCQGSAVKVLAVCTSGVLRSATVATVASQKGHNARACGTSPDALVQLSEALLAWADVVVFAENSHLSSVPSCMLAGKKTAVLSMADEYDYMHPELVDVASFCLDELL